MSKHPPVEQFPVALASVFKEAREEAGLSQKKLSELSGVGRTGIITFEAGERIPSVLLCKMMADALGVPLADLIAKAEKRMKG